MRYIVRGSCARAGKDHASAAPMLMRNSGVRSFDHLVGAGEQRRRNFKADRAGSRQVDD